MMTQSVGVPFTGKLRGRPRAAAAIVERERMETPDCRLGRTIHTRRQSARDCSAP